MQDFLKISTAKGLSDFLCDDSDRFEMLINPGIARLDIFPGGKPVPNSAELLDSPKMAWTVDRLKNRYRGQTILIDSPAVLACTDPIILSKYADAVIFVVEADRVGAEEVQEATKLLKSKPIIGAVLNKVR